MLDYEATMPLRRGYILCLLSFNCKFFVLGQIYIGAVCCRQSHRQRWSPRAHWKHQLVYSQVFRLTQGLLRDEFSREWEAYPEQEAAGAWRHLEDPATTKVLGGVLARLSGGKRAKL